MSVAENKGMSKLTPMRHLFSSKRFEIASFRSDLRAEPIVTTLRCRHVPCSLASSLTGRFGSQFDESWICLSGNLIARSTEWNVDRLSRNRRSPREDNRSVSEVDGLVDIVGHEGDRHLGFVLEPQ